MGKRYLSEVEKNRIENGVDPRLSEKKKDKDGYFKYSFSNDKFWRPAAKIALVVLGTMSLTGGCENPIRKFIANFTTITPSNQQPPASKP